MAGSSPWRFSTPELTTGMLELDGSHPDAQAYIHDTYARWSAMGISYTMCDFTSGPQTYWVGGGTEYERYHNTSMVKGPEVFRGLIAAMRAGAGDDFVLMACTGPDLCGVGLYDAARACVDSEEGRPHRFDPQGASYTNHGGSRHDLLVNACAKAGWHGVLYCIAAGGHLVTVDRPIGAGEARFNATLSVLSGGITISGDDPLHWSSEARQDLSKRCMPPMAGPLAILDLFNSGVGDDFAPGLFVRRVETSWDTWWILGHCNSQDTATIQSIDAAMLPLPAGAPPLDPTDLCIFDIHNECYVGGLSDHNTMTTNARDGSLWRIWRARPYPFVGGCDRHFSEGSWAVKDVQWTSASASAGTLAVTVRGLTTEPTTIRITLPSPWKPTDDTLGQYNLRVLRVFDEMCWCALHLPPAATTDDRLISLNFEQPSQ